MKLLQVLIAILLLPALNANAQPRHKLLVLSIDGLDHRYLRDADRLNLHIPNMRRLMKQGQWANGVVGVVPTITWPSHTTMVTGVPPHVHGIRWNRRPQSEGGEYPWTTDLIKVETLWHAAKKQGLTTAAITWPVTVGGPIDWNLPEYFQRRRGGAMDLESISSKSTPGLVGDITRKFPSFAQQWMDDRTRALATIYLLQEKQPDLMTVHFVDLDSEAHDTGPFSPASNAILEYTDELLGQILKAMPRNMALALVSDHGFARVDKTANLKMLMSNQGVNGRIDITPATACALDNQAAAWLASASNQSGTGVGRQIPAAEWTRYVPDAPPCLGAYEPADGFLFSTEPAAESQPRERGVHGLWPTRPDYRSIYILWHEGVKSQKLPELQMTDLAGRFAELMGLKFSPAAGK